MRQVAGAAAMLCRERHAERSLPRRARAISKRRSTGSNAVAQAPCPRRPAGGARTGAHDRLRDRRRRGAGAARSADRRRHAARGRRLSHGAGADRGWRPQLSGGCRDGGEARLQELGRLVDARAADVIRAIGQGDEARELLMTALLLADELDEARGVVAELARRGGDAARRPSRAAPSGSTRSRRSLRMASRAPRLRAVGTARYELLRLSLRRFNILGGRPWSDPGPCYMAPT